MNALKFMLLDISLYVELLLLRRCTVLEQEQCIQSKLQFFSSNDPEATEPALGVYPWFESDIDSYNCYTFRKVFRLNIQLGWVYYADPDNPEARIPPEPKLDPKISSKLEKLDKSKLPRRKPNRYRLERCRILLLPYLDAAVERLEKARTVAGKYELLPATTKAKDMYHPSKRETRRLIVNSDDTITFTNADGQRRDLLAVIVAKEGRGDADNPLLAYMGIVHTNRKERGEVNRVVYGIATDGFDFKILRIDNESNLRETYRYSVYRDFWIFLKYHHTILAEAAAQCEESSAYPEKVANDCRN